MTEPFNFKLPFSDILLLILYIILTKPHSHLFHLIQLRLVLGQERFETFVDNKKFKNFRHDGIHKLIHNPTGGANIKSNSSS